MLGVVLCLEEAGSGQVGEGGNDGFTGKLRKEGSVQGGV